MLFHGEPALRPRQFEHGVKHGKQFDVIVLGIGGAFFDGLEVVHRVFDAARRVRDDEGADGAAENDDDLARHGGKNGVGDKADTLFDPGGDHKSPEGTYENKGDTDKLHGALRPAKWRKIRELEYMGIGKESLTVANADFVDCRLF